MSSTPFTVRAMTAEDAPALAELRASQPNPGRLAALQPSFATDSSALQAALSRDLVGVVAEGPGGGLIGMGMASVGDCRYEAGLRSYIYVHTVFVHPAHRQRGLALEMARLRMELARRRASRGDGPVEFALIAQSNRAALVAVRHWTTQRLGGRIYRMVARVRGRPPRANSGLQIRPAEPEDFAEIVERQNNCFDGYNFFPPASPESLAARQMAPAGREPVSERYVAVDHRRNILSGLTLVDYGRLQPLHVVDMAWPVRAANRLLRLIPPDGTLSRVRMLGFWFTPGRLEAARHLWEAVCWLWRDRATLASITLDRRCPLAHIGLGGPLPLVPRSPLTLVLGAPVPMQPARLVYAQHL
jgi:L-amino acid N-acyltransferase YncA